MKYRFLSIAVLVSALMWPMSGRAEQPSSVQADEQGEFTITQPTKAGDLTLQAGTYAIQHHTSKGRNVIRFMRVQTERKLQLTRAYTGWKNEKELVKVGDVTADATTAAKAPATTMTITHENGTPRITRVTIKGKSAVYDLPRK